MQTKTLTQNPLKQPVPPYAEWGAFTSMYRRVGWNSTVHIVHTKGGDVRAYVSDYSLSSSLTLQDLARKATKIKADMKPWVSHTRLIDWANTNAMYVKHWRQADDNTVEVFA